MKKVIAWLLVLALTAAVSIGATLAYLTDTDEDVNVMTLGKVKIDQLEYERVDTETKDDEADVQEFHDNKPLYPGVYEDGFDFGTEDSSVNWGQIGKDGYTSGIWNPEEINNEVDKMVFVKNKGDYDAYVRSVFAFEAGNYTTLDEFQKMVHLNLNGTDWTWEWAETPVTIGESTYFVATATYNKVLAPSALTEISLSQIALDKTATNEDVEAFGETYQVLVKSQGIQADGFEKPDVALNEGFGEISTDPENVSIPWENDAATKGTTVRDALHNLDGEVITTKVKTVTFGLTEKYAAIAAENKGVLVDVEQDVPVYAYYVSEGSNYRVYFLADDTIYLPKISTELFKGMSALTEVKTDNLDVSRVENMHRMFRECSNLTTLDTTDWDTSKVTDMSQAFYKCVSLTELDLSGWNLPALGDASNMLRQCANLKRLDLSGWNAPALTNASFMFYNDPALETVDITGWNTPAVENLSYLFSECSSLKEVIGSGDLDTDSAKNLSYMFKGCGKLTAIDGTENWKVTNATTTNSMFRLCTKLVDLDTSTWQLVNVTDTRSMFSDCESLKELDATNYGMPKNVDVGYMFSRCYELVTVKSTNWSLASVDIMHCMFYQCKKLKNVDTSNWQTGNVTDMQYAFYSCMELEYLDVADWDVSKVTSFFNMFASMKQNDPDMKLKNLDLSKWKPVSAVNMAAMFYGCGLLTELDLSDWNMPNLTTVSHMFADCHNLKVIDVSGWQTPSLVSLDAMFNHCKSLKFIDFSSFDTSNVREFSQVYEHCYSIETIKGLENFDTKNGHDFSEMFSNCYALKELNLSTFDTRNANAGYVNSSGCENWMFLSFVDSCTGLEKITFGPYFSFDGDGSAPNDYKFFMSSSTNVEGWDGHWYDADGKAYAPSQVPEETKCTYYAVKPVNP